jgi:hypothetical protein
MCARLDEDRGLQGNTSQENGDETGEATRSAMMSSVERRVDAMQMREQDEYADAVV